MKKLFLIILLSIVFLSGCGSKEGTTTIPPRGALNSIANQTTNEATAKFVTLSGRSTVSSDMLTYWATSSNSDVGVNVSGHTLTLTPNSDWNGSATITVTMNCISGGLNHCNPRQTFTLTVNEFTSGSTFKGKIYQTVTSPDTGRVWLDRNLGASRVCTSSSDSSCYGHLYQWGRNDDGHELRTSHTTTTQATNISPNSTRFIIGTGSLSDWMTVGDDSDGALRIAASDNAGVNDICPAGFRVPTIAELVADTVEAIATDVTNAATAYSSFLRLPVAGYRETNGSLSDVNSAGMNDAMSNTGGLTRRITWNSASASWYNGIRSYGSSIRCIKDL